MIDQVPSRDQLLAELAAARQQVAQTVGRHLARAKAETPDPMAMVQEPPPEFARDGVKNRSTGRELSERSEESLLSKADLISLSSLYLPAAALADRKDHDDGSTCFAFFASFAVGFGPGPAAVVRAHSERASVPALEIGDVAAAEKGKRRAFWHPLD